MGYCSLKVVHVEQEAASGNISVLESVLECDEERSQLMIEEKELMAKLEEVCSNPFTCFPGTL